MSDGFVEPDAEEAALGWLEALGYTIKHGPEIAFGIDGGERADPEYRDTILQNRLYEALNRLNPNLPPAAIGEAYRKLVQVEGAKPRRHDGLRPEPLSSARVHKCRCRR
jgi:type I restriction enzyme R subunit